MLEGRKEQTRKESRIWKNEKEREREMVTGAFL